MRGFGDSPHDRLQPEATDGHVQAVMQTIHILGDQGCTVLQLKAASTRPEHTLRPGPHCINRGTLDYGVRGEHFPDDRLPSGMADGSRAGHSDTSQSLFIQSGLAS